MTFYWGPTLGFGSGNETRLGVDAYVLGSVESGEVTARGDFYIWTKYSIGDGETLNGAGLYDGRTIAFNNSQGGGANLYIGTWDRQITTLYGTPQRFSVGGWITGHQAGISPSVEGFVDIPARPYLAPRQPPAVGVSRVSDTRHTISWTTDYDSGSGPQPWSGVQVERWDNVANAYKRVADIKPVTTTSWADTTTAANRRYRWRARSYNSAGVSAWTYSVYVYTTPAAPTGVTAVKSGADIKVTWTDAATAETGFRIIDAPGGTWDYATEWTVGAGVTTWTHQAPSAAVTHRYAVRAVAGSLESAWSYSDTVQLLAPPAAPSALTSGAVFDASQAYTVTWQHNPVDTTAQTAFEVQHREVGATAWITTGKLTAAGSARTFAVGALQNGKRYEWQVRTWGQHATASPWSALATFTTSATPTAVVDPPADGSVVTSSVIEAVWAYYDAEGTAQAAWRSSLRRMDGPTPGAVVDTRSGTGATDRVTYTGLVDGAAYRVVVDVQDGSGLWGNGATTDFTVDYAEPAPPALTAVWDAETGSVLLTVDNPVPGPGQAETVTNTVYRSTPDGGWVVVAADVIPGGAVTDHIPPLGATVTYRATAVSALPSVADSAPVEVVTKTAGGWCYLNGGPGFGTLARVRANVQLTPKFGRAKALHRFAGRTAPVEFTGDQRTRTWGLSVRTAPTYDGGATAEDLEALADLPGPVCWRDPLGHRWFASMGEVTSSYRGVVAEAAVDFTEVDHRE